MKSLAKQEKTGKNAAKVPRDLEEKQTPAGIDPHDLESMENEKESDYKIYNNTIYSLVDDFIENEYKGIPESELKQDKAFFPLLVKYLYDNYIGDLLRNKTEYRKNKIKPIYNINNIDSLFDVYIDLVYRYKWNNRPLIIEFSLFTGINRDYIYDWYKGLNNNYLIADKGDKESTNNTSDIIAKWIGSCERALIDGNDTIKDIFILKAKHGYKDNNNDIQITVNHKAIIDADNLPDLIGISSKN